MVPIRSATQELADRIERSYRRSRPRWRLDTSNPGVWAHVASTLLGLHDQDPDVPVDPELFVASQPPASPLDDPWMVLAQDASAGRYLTQVRRILRGLRRELRGEVRRAEARASLGVPLEAILRAGATRISPLGRIILAHRAGRSDLAQPWHAAATRQHQSCPLYRQACRGILHDDDYPAINDQLPSVILGGGLRLGNAPQFSMN